jgi:hypothetical protein
MIKKEKINEVVRLIKIMVRVSYKWRIKKREVSMKYNRILE